VEGTYSMPEAISELYYLDGQSAKFKTIFWCKSWLSQ